jgi:diguanylate cyclase (GGDEF)-like protein/PAS domain S-box-containing protein
MRWLTSALRAAGALARDPLLLGLGAVMVLGCGWLLADVAGAGTQVLMFWLIQVPLDVLLLLTCLAAARQPETPAPARRFWKALGFAGASFAIGDTTQVVQAILQPGAAAVVPGIGQTIGFAVGALVVLVVMLAYPTAAHTGRERARFWLDVATVMVGGTVFIWCLQIAPVAATASAQGRLGALTGVVIGSVLALLVGFSMMKLMLSGATLTTRMAGSVLASATGLFVVGNVFTPAEPSPGQLPAILAVRLLPAILVVAAPRIHALQVRARPDVFVARRQKPFSLLPYFAVIATFALMLVLLPGGLTVASWGAVGGVVAITALVVARQLAAFLDNGRLIRQLDESLLTQRLREQRFSSLVQHSSDITTIAQADGIIRYISPAVDRVLHVSPEQVLGGPGIAEMHPDDKRSLDAQLAALVAKPATSMTYQARFRHADGSWRWLEVVSTNLIDDPSVNGIVSNARDVTVARHLQDTLRHQATHDVLTGLANRALFTERLQQATQADHGGNAQGAAVLLIDLDDFKIINDTLGHHAGDAVLLAVADRLKACFGTSGLSARLGGDEFAVLLPEADEGTAYQLAQRFLDMLAEPVAFEDRHLTAKASLGIAVGRASFPNELLQQADAAMYAAKHGGKGRLAQLSRSR